MLSCLSSILRHINNMKEGEIFTTRDCLRYGSRSNVDTCLFRCVRAGIIVRLTRGVFTRWTKTVYYPSYTEMAHIKARAFGKEVLTHGKDTAFYLKFESQKNDEPTYFVDGSTSKFWYHDSYINLRKACKKKMHIPDGRVGLALRALWHMGQEWVEKHGVEAAFHPWATRVDKEEVHASKAWMPWWLADQFIADRYYGPFPAGSSPTALPSAKFDRLPPTGRPRF